MADPVVHIVGDVEVRLTALRRHSPHPDDDEPDVVVLQESSEYAYTLARPAHTLVHLEPRELFSADASGLATGRLRTRLRVGRVPVVLTWRAANGESDITRLTLDIHTRKLTYRSHYRWMLADIAQILAEAAMHRFAPSELRLVQDGERDARTLYHRFAFLEAMVESTLDGALRVIRRAPYVSWVERRERVDPRRGIRASGTVARAFSRPGPRVPVQRAVGRLASIPRRVEVARTDPSVDNPPNRFVRFALDAWIALVDEMRASLDAATTDRDETFAVARGKAGCDRLSAILRRERHAAWLDDVGRLTRFPAANTVLQGRAGYRAVFRTWLAAELAGQITWTGGEDVFGAGQRDVATLYEYWVYLTIARVVGELTDRAIDPGDCLSTTADGLAITLRVGEARAIHGVYVHPTGRRLALRLFFNQTFGRRDRTSWTLRMRPDCSLHVVAEDLADESGAGLWVHFDAKYRVKFATSSGTATDRLRRDPSIEAPEAMAPSDDDAFEAELDAEAGSTLPNGSPKRADLVKMHAYRDAIGHSAGAFVVYPGTAEPRFRRFPQEVLPGLGALALRPGEGGAADGEDALRAFVGQVLDHAATQTSRRERAWWWQREAYADGGPAASNDARATPPLPFLDRPPADAWVLLGWVHGDAHRAWALERGLYNLRADPDRDGAIGLGSRELAAEWVLLYGPGQKPALRRVADLPRLLDAAALSEAGYPTPPGGRHYFVLPLAAAPPARVDALWSWVGDRDLTALAATLQGPDVAIGAPRVVSWQRLMEALG